MADSTEIEITFKLKTRSGLTSTQPQMTARGLIADMREAIIQSEHNKMGTHFNWNFDITGESFKTTQIEG